jgi:hypothetical protein
MGIVYMLSWNGLGYIGSTIQKLEERIRNHHIDFKEGYKLSIVEEVENETKQECREREQFWIEFFSTFGKLENMYNSCGRNKEKIKTNDNIYRKNIENITKINNRAKNYYEKNKEKILQRRRELYSLHNTNGEQD